MSALDEVLINARSDWGYNSFELAKIIMAEQEVYNMRARIAELENPWQPIETAPKDGTVIRVSDLLGRERLASWYKESKYFDGHWMLKLEKIPEITHWMPLPPVPNEDK